MSMQGRHHDKGQIKEELISTYETITMPNARSRGPVLDGLERGQACQLHHPRPQPLRCCLQRRLDSSHSIYWQLFGRRSSLSVGDNFHSECPDRLAWQLSGQNLQICGHQEIWWVAFTRWWFSSSNRSSLCYHAPVPVRHFWLITQPFKLIQFWLLITFVYSYSLVSLGSLVSQESLVSFLTMQWFHCALNSL